MDVGSIDLRELRDVVAEKPSFIRCTLDREEDGWTLGYVEAVVGKCPPEWLLVAWEYDTVAFVAEKIAGNALAKALDGADGRTLPVGRYQRRGRVAPNPPVTRRRRPSPRSRPLSRSL